MGCCLKISTFSLLGEYLASAVCRGFSRTRIFDGMFLWSCTLLTGGIEEDLFNTDLTDELRVGCVFGTTFKLRDREPFSDLSGDFDEFGVVLVFGSLVLVFLGLRDLEGDVDRLEDFRS